MASDRRRMSIDLQLKFQESTKLVLSEWSLLQNLVQSLWDRKAELLKSDILLFFTETPEPDMDSIASMLNEATMKSVNALYLLVSPSKYKALGGPWSKEDCDIGLGLSLEPCTQPVEDLWSVYQSCLEDDNTNDKLMLSLHKFEQALQVFLSDWSNLKNSIHSFTNINMRKINLDIFDFFCRTPEPAVCAAALMLRQSINTALETNVELGTCNQVAQQLFTTYQRFFDKS